MTLLAGALLGLLVAVVAFLALYWTMNRERSDVGNGAKPGAVLLLV
jgi:uncharacterized protein involved in exopolysaccharide biosynthesis